MRSMFCFNVIVLICIDRIYAIGGQSLNSAEVYYPEIDEWFPITPMKFDRYQLAAVALNGKIYAIGKNILNKINF